MTDPEADITVTGRAEDAIVQVADAEYAFTELIDGRTERMETGRTEEVYA